MQTSSSSIVVSLQAGVPPGRRAACVLQSMRTVLLRCIWSRALQGCPSSSAAALETGLQPADHHVYPSAGQLH